MQKSADIIVVGAGHNSLSAACYLAEAGMSVLVLEKNNWIGGGVVTREVTAEGFKHDLHSTAHMFIQANPMISNDELDLQSKFGLEYIKAPVFFTSRFPDGSVIQSFGDLDKSCESIAKFSQKDAQTYREFVAQSTRLLPLFKMGLFNPPMPFGTFLATLDQSPDGKVLIGDMLKSTYDIVTEMFENEKVQMHFMRWSAESMAAPETKGTGAMLYMMCSFVHHYKCSFPRGGSGSLSIALQRCLEHHGGVIETGCDVKQLIMKGGKAVGVELADGTVVSANKAVLASVHPAYLNDFIGGTLDQAIQKQVSRLSHSDYAAMNTHYALNEAPKYKADTDIDMSFAVETQPETMEEFRLSFDSFRYNKIPDHLSVLSICTSNHDNTRAPDGKATLYLYTFMPYQLAQGGASSWNQAKEEVADRMLETLQGVTTNMTSDNIISRYVESPLDMETDGSDSFKNGDIVGIGFHLFQFMGRRPTPELANYTVPGLDGFYMVGPCMHPGGGVIGGGRPVAIKVMRDMKMNLDRFTTA